MALFQVEYTTLNGFRSPVARESADASWACAEVLKSVESKGKGFGRKFVATSGILRNPFSATEEDKRH